MSEPARLRHRGHVFHDLADRDDRLTAFLAQGLEAGGACRVIVYLHAPDRAIGGLAGFGVDVGEALLREALDVVPAIGTPLLEARFDAADSLTWVRSIVAEALTHSFSGLWLAIDMRWALASAVGETGLAAFERGLDAMTHELPLSVLCLYDGGSFPKEWLRRAERAHQRFASEGPPRPTL